MQAVGLRTTRQIIGSPLRHLVSRPYSLMSAPMPKAQTNASSNRRGRSRGGRGRGRGGGGGAPASGPASEPASASGPSLLQRLATPPLPAGQTRAFSTTQGLLAGYQSSSRFLDAPLLPQLKKNIPSSWEFMSEIQAQTVNVCLSGKDLLAQAKTGTGKTVAFLLPTIQRLVQNPMPSGQVRAIIITPTRELAIQIVNECRPLIKDTNLKVGSVVGGTNINSDVKMIGNGCDILVATPGRLNDHLENTILRQRISHLQSLVLDEADRLLDMGFAPDIRKIVAALPNRAQVPRQSMLFSATMPDAVVAVKNIVLLRDHAHVSTLDPAEVNAHMHVDQHVLTAPLNTHMSILTELIRADIRQHGNKSKIMAFYPIARGAQFACAVLQGVSGFFDDGRVAGQKTFPVFEQHSRLSQAIRIRTADAFGKSPNGVMVTSDVTARGMDFPNVTLVVQMTAPNNDEDYVHRLGRTARAGTDGYGILVLAPFEQGFLRRGGMTKMPIKEHPETSAILAGAAAIQPNVHTATRAVPEDVRSKAYSATLGQFLNTKKTHKFSDVQIVNLANEWAADTLLWPGNQPPALSTKTAGKMGIRKIPGLNLFVEERQPRNGGGGGGRRGD